MRIPSIPLSAQQEHRFQVSRSLRAYPLSRGRPGAGVAPILIAFTGLLAGVAMLVIGLAGAAGWTVLQGFLP